MKKNLKTVAILLLLFGLPAGSWYFLNGGLQWRKGKIEDLKPKERFLYNYNFSDEDKTKIFEELSHRTAVVKLNSDLTDKDMTIIDQFRNSPTFMFFVMAKNVRIADAYGKKVPLRYIKTMNITSQNYEYDNAQYLLVDTSGYIRKHYNWGAEEVHKNIVEDLAVLLPRKKSPDIKTKK